MPTEPSSVRPLFRGLAVISALGLLGLYVLQAQQSAQKDPAADAAQKEDERKKKPAMASGTKALAPPSSEQIAEWNAKRSGSAQPTPKSTLVAPSSKSMVMPGSKRGELRLPIGQAQVTPTPAQTPTPAASPSPAVTPAPTATPTPGPLK